MAALAEYFWSKVAMIPFHECWEWAAFRDHAGYGRINSRHHRSPMAHRAAYEIARGPIPEGMDVLHSCDNRSCVNPDHLFLGTQTDNNRDRHSKGRSRGPHWSNNNRTKLSWDDVQSIRSRRAAGEMVKNIAASLGVNRHTVSSICAGRQRRAR